MKATGIVRRIDDLGRVVIPKEIRRTLRIKEGDPLEIYTDRDGEVIFKKYSPIAEMQDFAGEYAAALQKSTGVTIFVCDKDAIICVSGASKKEFLEKKVSKGLEHIMDSRTIYAPMEVGDKTEVIDNGGYHIGCAMPIISDGDVIGCICTAYPSGSGRSAKISSETEQKLIYTAGLFLGKQVEN